MKNSYVDGIILANNKIADNMYKIKLSGNFKGEPGQFYMIKGWNGLDPFLARPMSISDIEDGNLTILYEVVGRGTHMISELRKGDKLSLLGPLGSSYNIKTENRKVALIGGGTGIAPMLFLARELSKDKNIEIDLYAGFREESFYIDEFKDYLSNISLSTESGLEGHKGYIVDIIDFEKYDGIYTCGPGPMTNAILKKIRDKRKLQVSLESRMACGIGICYGCNIETKTGMKRVCKEGPIFKGSELILND